jgi:glutamate racemase
MRIGRRVHLIDSSICVATDLKRFLDHHAEIDKRLAQNGKLTLFVSDITDQFQKVVTMTLKTDPAFECVKI